MKKEEVERIRKTILKCIVVEQTSKIHLARIDFLLFFIHLLVL